MAIGPDGRRINTPNNLNEARSNIGPDGRRLNSTASSVVNIPTHVFNSPSPSTSSNIGPDGRRRNAVVSNTTSTYPGQTVIPVPTNPRPPQEAPFEAPKRDKFLTLGIFSVVALIVFLVLTKSGGSSSIPSPAQVPTYVQTPAKSTIKTPTQTTTPGQLKPGTKYGYIVTKEAGSRVYLRPGPAKKGGQPVLQDGNRVVVLDTSATKDGTWYYIDYNGQRGFVHSSLLNIPQTTSNAGNVRNNTSSAQTRAAQTTSPAQKNQSASNNQGTASKYVAEGKKQWQLKNWQAAYNAFDQAYKQSPTNEIKTYRENALANLRGEKEEAARQLAFKQAAADAAAAEAARQRTAQELAEKQRQEEEARKLAAKQRQQENTANVIKGILSIGAQLLNK